MIQLEIASAVAMQCVKTQEIGSLPQFQTDTIIVASYHDVIDGLNLVLA